MSQNLMSVDESRPIAQVDAPCSRCGILIPWMTIAKRASRGNTEDRCRDCIPRDTVHRIQKPGIKNECNPWAGDVDLDTMQPLNANGEPHMPGIRICGHLDCCNRNHVISFESLEAERHDLSYRTGKRRNYEQLLAALRKEKHA
jgi:hypothetical protein